MKKIKVGIFSYHFLDIYEERSKNLECCKCGLISPKNYIIECNHCICQKCLKYENFCTKCKNQNIVTSGEDPTAFQFIVTEQILNPYRMKCIFEQCDWKGAYLDFIKTHSKQCEFRENYILFNEYFEEFKNKEYKKEDNKRNNRSKSEFKVNRKNKKNSTIYLDESDDDGNVEEINNYEEKSVNELNHNYTLAKINQEKSNLENHNNFLRPHNENHEIIYLKDDNIDENESFISINNKNKNIFNKYQNYNLINKNQNKNDEIFINIPENLSKKNTNIRNQKIFEETIYLDDVDEEDNNNHEREEEEEIEYGENEANENYENAEENNENYREENKNEGSINNIFSEVGLFSSYQTPHFDSSSQNIEIQYNERIYEQEMSYLNKYMKNGDLEYGQNEEEEEEEEEYDSSEENGILNQLLKKKRHFHKNEAKEKLDSFQRAVKRVKNNFY